MKQLTITLLLILILAACAPSAVTSNPAKPQPTIVLTTEAAAPSGNDTSSSAALSRKDEQGAVTVEVTPLNLNNPSDQLEFDISLETHSVDLSMDLATLATLTTDTGITVQATSWDAPRGGHHVQGKLIFPALQDGKPILEGTSKLTLTITNVDAPSRIFEWQLQ